MNGSIKKIHWLITISRPVFVLKRAVDVLTDWCGVVWLRGSDCKYRESADKLKKLKILITCQKNTFGELSSTILLKPSGILLFSGNSEKRFCLIYYAIIRLKIKEIESTCF